MFVNNEYHYRYMLLLFYFVEKEKSPRSILKREPFVLRCGERKKDLRSPFIVREIT